MDIGAAFRISVCLYNNYINNETIEADLPLRGLRFVDDLPGEILKAQPELKTKNGIDEEQLKIYSGYTVPFSDNTAEILIDANSLMNNFYFFETFYHEMTHVKDFTDYIRLLNCKSFKEMCDTPYYYYWTEFHASYKGHEYMLLFVSSQPKETVNQYLDDTCQRILNFSNTLSQQINYNGKIYHTMHMIGEILAYEQSSISISNDFYKCIADEFEWFEKTKAFLSDHMESMTVEEMLLLYSNLIRIFTA